MYHKLKTYSKKEIETIVKQRKPGAKFGEKMNFIHSSENLIAQISASKSKFVLLGIPEDAGILGNYGIPGARFTWPYALEALLNMQHNNFCKAGKLLLLGYLDFKKELKELDYLISEGLEYIEKARDLTTIIDKEVTYYVRLIVASGKKPIIVGGGHNNCYGIIKGCALAFNQPIDVFNIDAHTDLRVAEGRHSGNGFTYAFQEGFIDNYFICGLHEYYVSSDMLKRISAEKTRIQYITYEELAFKNLHFDSFIKGEIEGIIGKAPFGIELDCDAIKDIPSSAMTPTGFSVQQIRTLIYKLSTYKNATYLHICEAATDKEKSRESIQTGKLIAYLIADFIRNRK